MLKRCKSCNFYRQAKAWRKNKFACEKNPTANDSY